MPTKPTTIAPSGDIRTNPPTYTWNAVSTATQYQLWVNDATGNKIKTWYTAAETNCVSGTGTCSIKPAVTLATGNATWWVRGWNSAGYGPWSDGRAFTVATGGAKPGKATTLVPSGAITDTTPTYTWNAVSNSTWYYLWVNDSTGTKIRQWYTAAQAGCSSGTGTCAVTPATPLAAGAGQWWIQTWNQAGYGPWSAGLTFTVHGGSAPGAATLISPSGAITDTTPTYTWTAVANSTWYYLWVNDSTGTKIRQWYTAAQAGCSSGTGTCSVTPATPLAAGAGQWWIQTWNSAGYGLWSDGRVFTVSTGG